jgi:hypothetical protein
MPQLASGELGWAIDSQELYIGNGSVAEGSPAVGNTRLLTEKDFSNVLDFAKLYAYKPNDIQTGLTPGSKTYRSLQERLDEQVSVRAFGAKGDGVTDDTASIQRALDQLFLNGSGGSSPQTRRSILYFPPGTYIISDTLHLPPYAILIGSGKGNTVISSEAVTAFDTVTSNSVPGTYDYTLSINTNLVPPVVTSPLPKFILVKDMTVEVTGSVEIPDGEDAPEPNVQSAIFLRNCFDSLFENILIKGIWSIEVNIQNYQAGIMISSDYMDISANNRFSNVDIQGFTYGIYSDYDIRNNTFTDGSIKNCMYGVVFGEKPIPVLEGYALNGPRFNTIKNTMFDRISKQGIKIITGDYNYSENNKFFNVGNRQGAEYRAEFPIIDYTTNTNVSSNDFFERSTSLYAINDNNNTINYVPEVSGKVRVTIPVINQLSINENKDDSNTFADVIKLPMIENGKLFVDYTFTGVIVGNGRFIKSGVVEIITGTDGTILINDSSQYAGSDLFLDSFVFNAEVREYNQTPDTDLKDLVLIMSEIPALTNDNFSYTIRIQS